MAKPRIHHINEIVDGVSADIALCGFSVSGDKNPPVKKKDIGCAYCLELLAIETNKMADKIAFMAARLVEIQRLTIAPDGFSD